MNDNEPLPENIREAVDLIAAVLRRIAGDGKKKKRNTKSKPEGELHDE